MKDMNASIGTAADAYTHMDMGLLVASLTQPRKIFQPEKLQDLADSIRAHGVLQPILVRKLPGYRLQDTALPSAGAQRPTHEIISGERRFRASKLAGLQTIPAIIRDWTDDWVLEIQIVENLQRDDLTALEEAEGYEALMAHNQINAEEVGEKIGKSRSYVYSKLKLLDLATEGKDALRDGTIDTSRALLIARIPDSKLQIKALSYATEASGGEVPSLRALQVWLRQNVMLQLDRAPFQITDANLLPLAGSCKSCPKRTGAAPDIFSDVDGADICTDTICYNEKSEAHLAKLQHQADKRGMRLVYGSEAKAICYEKSSTLAGYSPLSQIRQDAGGKRLDHLLSPSPTAPIPGAVLIENPFTHELIAAIPTKEAEAALLAKGLLQAADEKSSKADKTDSYASNVSRLKKTIVSRVQEKYEALLQAAVVQAVINTDDAETPHLLSPKLLAVAWADEIRFHSGKEALELLDSQGEKLEELSDAKIYRFAALFLSVGDNATSEALAEANGIHLGRLRESAKVQIQDDVAAEIAALKREKTPAPIPPLAQPNQTREAGAKTPSKTPAKPLAKARKLSPEDAQLGIAEAMQGLEGEAALAASQTPATLPGATPHFEIGQQVRVTSDTSKLGLAALKRTGKRGTITAREPGGQFWDVTFKGRSGGITKFAEDQLEISL